MAAYAVIAAEDAAQLVSLLAPLLVVALVAAVVASAWADGAVRVAAAQVDAQAGEWARYVFGSEDAELAAPPSPLPVAWRGEHG
ncbi:hypothetical protein SETIT_9G120200v2 [Setaria italica]|uniref:Uncharacterized protein n=2 Tax=Setaria TaxID=4554 RepID=A0A368SFU6_SETIT|nr:hypothetical protein SETIT_9G120200v2 [Setaria italica]